MSDRETTEKEHEAAVVLAKDFDALLSLYPAAVNYLSLTFMTEDYGRIEVMAQRAGKQTPAEYAAEQRERAERAEAERDAARAEVDSVRSTLIDVLDAGGAPDIESLATGGVARVFGVCYAAMVGRADAAEAQLARLAEWHPASEPPDDDRWVLVCWPWHGQWLDSDRCIDGEWETYGATVTHWRELPPGPAMGVKP